MGDAVDGDPEEAMLDCDTEGALAEQLLRVAREPDLRQQIYERLGEYCHQCRNRLNSLKLSLYLARRQSAPPSRGLWDDLDRSYKELERRVDRVQTLCRPMSLSKVKLGLDLLIDDRREDWSRTTSAGGLSLEIVPPRERAVAFFDVDRMGQALDSLVAWRSASETTDRSASLRWWVEAGTAHLTWVEEAVAATSGPDPRPGEGPTWDLPLFARVVLAHGGDFRVLEGCGWCLEVSWPS